MTVWKLIDVLSCDMTIDNIHQTLDPLYRVMWCDASWDDVVTAEGGRVHNFPDQADKKEGFYRDAGQELYENTTGAKCLISSRLVFSSVSTHPQDLFHSQTKTIAF